MTRAIRLCTISLAGVAGLMVLFANESSSLKNASSLVSEAQARVGRPLTPMSGAGVARRTTRRATYGAAAGAAAVGAAAVGARAVLAPGCIRDRYGHVVCR